MSVSKKRLFFVITKATWGGAQKYVYDLLHHLPTEYEASLVFGVPGTLLEKEGINTLTQHSIKELARDPSPINDSIAFLKLFSLFRRKRPDIVHLNSSKAGFLGALAARLAGVPKIVFTCHGWAFTEPRSFLSKGLFWFFHYLTVLFSDTIILVSGALLDYAKKWRLPTKKMIVVTHGVPSIDFFTREEARKKIITMDSTLANYPNDFWVVTIAELHKNKGIDVGIEAWKCAQKREGAQWVVIGSGEESESLKKQKESCESIHLIGHVPDAARYLRAFDLMMVPSRTEALGYVILEAGQAGVAVIGSRVGGIRNILSEETGALVQTENPEDLAQIIGTYMRDTEALSLLQKALTKRIEEEFQFKEMLKKTFALYESPTSS